MSESLLRELSAELGIGRHDLLRIISTAPLRYKVYPIPKRRGGTRIIAQPSRELKAIQRYLLEGILAKLPVHPAATAYIIGRNISQNASAHVQNRTVLKLDFKDFFPSIAVRDWERYIRGSQVRLEPSEIAIYSKILFWGRRSPQPRCLSIGAPTSPALSNILLYDLDKKLSDAASELAVSYTRYADDITVSGETLELLRKFEKIARSIVRDLKSPRLTFNDEKRGVYTMGQKRMVTGLVLTPTHSVSIGRQRKRLISVMLHKVSVGKSDPEAMAMLKGLLGFSLANEAAFVSRMRLKYGDDVVDGVLKHQVPKKRPQATRGRGA